MKNCMQCQKEMNPVEALLNPVCGKCCRRNHLAAIEHGVSRVSGDLVNEDGNENSTGKGGGVDGRDPRIMGNK